jgi:hypothetical protein
MRITRPGRPVPRAARRVLLGALAVLSTLPGAAVAQAPMPTNRGWTAVRSGKWALLAASVGFGAYALAHSRQAQRDYDQLSSLCQTQPAACSIGASGIYDDPAAEALYQGAGTNDRQARVGIIGGQIMLLGSATLFIMDLRGTGRPPNIPYPSSGFRSGPSLAIGLRVPFALRR